MISRRTFVIQATGLGAALAGAPFAEWDAYYPAQQDHYRRSWQAAVGHD